MSQLFNLNKKIAVITGASNGMGKSIAQQLSVHGATVIVSSNDEAGCKKVAASLTNKGRKAYGITCDVEKKNDIYNLINYVETKIGNIDILVSCVGYAQNNLFSAIDETAVDKTIELNLKAAIYLSKLELPNMQKNNDGVIIYLSSIASVRGNKTLGLYGISKAALNQLARNLAVEYGPYNIRVNTIAPGLIDTDFSNPLKANKAVLKKRLLQTPLRRMGKPSEVAGIALLLASQAGAFITGQNIIVDGGTTISDGN